MSVFDHLNNLFPKVLNKLGFLGYFNLLCYIRINNSKLVIPILEKVGYQNLNLSELWMIDLLYKFKINKNDVFLDVGTNIGQTLLKVKIIDPDIEYIGFEPNPSCYYYTNKLSKSNSFIKTTLIPIGLSDTNILLNLNLYSDDTSSAATIIENFRPRNTITGQVLVPLFRLDEIEVIQNYTRITFLKIDVEGAELDVLKGAIETIRKHKPVILIEMLPVYNKDNIIRLQRQTTIEELLTSVGYRCYRIIKDPNNRLKNLEFINSIGINSSLELTDYVFTCRDL